MSIGLFVFVLALQFLKQGTAVYGQQMIQWFSITNATSTLGFGWLLAYVFLSGSPVAAVAISFFASGTLTDLQTFTMITGSRLGASMVVLLVGFVYYLRGYRQKSSIAIGILALLTTAAIYVPALIPGYWMLTSGILSPWQVSASQPLDSWLDGLITPIIDTLGLWLPGWAFLVGGVGALLFSFSLFDRALPEIDPSQNTSLITQRLIYNPLAMFCFGALLTSITLSVSVSLSLLVPLSVKGLIRPKHIVPYIMGANITTFIDTLVAALVVGGTTAFTIVLVEVVSVTLLSLFVLLFCYRPFEKVLLCTQELILQSRKTLLLFLGVMLLIPLVLLMV
ncbi:MAG: hypothetical protein HC837_01900 [Chloroflexaceae bacterium]|nr:hypothetical protein [Chloroflexaceae bacterium]